MQVLKNIVFGVGVMLATAVVVVVLMLALMFPLFGPN